MGIVFNWISCQIQKVYFTTFELVLLLGPNIWLWTKMGQNLNIVLEFLKIFMEFHRDINKVVLNKAMWSRIIFLK